MANPAELQQINFAAGIDESMESELLDPTATFRRLENSRQDKTGGASKRLGFTNTGRTRLGGGARVAGRRLLERNGTPVILDASTLDEYAPALGVSPSHPIGLPECAIKRQFAATQVASVLASTDFLTDIGFVNGYFALAQTSGSLGYLSVVDINGVTIRSPEVVFSIANVIVLCASYSTYLIAVGVTTGSANITAFYLDTSTPTTIAIGWVGIGNIATDHHNGGGLGNPDAYFDLQQLSDRIAFVYRNTSAGTSRLTVASFNISGPLQTTTINTSSVTPDNACIFATSTSALWVGWNEGTSVKAIGLTPTALTTVLSTTGTLMTLDATGVDTIGIIWFDFNSTGRIIVTEATQDRTQMRGFMTTTGATVTNGTQQRVPVAQMTSKPFPFGTRCYAVFDAYTSSVVSVGPPQLFNRQGLGVLCDWSVDQTWIRPVAIADPFLSITTGGLIRFHVAPVSATQFATLYGVLRNAEGIAAEIVTFDFASDKKRSAVSIGGSLHLGDALTTTYDGSRIFELGFVPRPPTPTTTLSGGTGLTGTYNYVVTYENVDADGRLARSSVSNPVTALPSANTVNVKFRPCTITNRQLMLDGSQVRIVLWRTNATGLAPYYRLTTFNNITSSAFTTYADTTTDATLQAQALLMNTGNLPGTNGSSQDHRTVTGLENLVNYNGFIVGSRNADLYWSSQLIGGEELWFSPIFTVSVPEDVVALVPLDGALYILTRRGVYVTSGDPPTDNGATGGLGPLRKLSSDAGCIDSGSVIGTGIGIFFQSDRGIELLGRDGSVQWIGQRVQRTTDAFPFITSAVLDTQNAIVRFTLATTRTNGVVTAAGGCSLVYDLTLSIWVSKDLVTGQIAGEAAQDAAMVVTNGIWRYAWLGQDGYLYTENQTTDGNAYLDGAAWIQKLAQTPDFKIGGYQGLQVFNKLLLLERMTTGHDVQIEVAYDYGSVYQTPTVYSAATVAGLLAAGWPITQLQQDGHDQAEGQAVRIRLTELTPSSGVVGTGRGATWLALTFDITPKPGAMPLPDGAT